MDFKHALQDAGIEPSKVLALRHTPGARLAKAYPMLALDRPDLFNAYQRTQSVAMENKFNALLQDGYISSFVGLETGSAVFAGLFRLESSRRVTPDEYFALPEVAELERLGYVADFGSRKDFWLYELSRQPFYLDWIGKLVIGWKPKGQTWWRTPGVDPLPIQKILDEDLFGKRANRWDEIDVSWAELQTLPDRWKSILSQWHAVYYIFDSSDGRGYVGSAYGSDSLYGRWKNYGELGHGGNELLKDRDPANFRFSILELLPSNLAPKEVVRREVSWKLRLHTREAFGGLNKN